MTTDSVIKSYIGFGKVQARAFGTTGGFRHVGNVSKVNLSHKLDVKEQRDYTQGGGGMLIRHERIKSIDAAMTWLTFTPANWALATAGVLVQVEAADILDKVVKGYKGATVRLAHPPATVASVTNSAATTTYAPFIDYELSGAGLAFPADSTIVNAADLKVDYHHDAYSRIEGAMGSSSLLEIIVEGLNEVDSDKPVIVDLWKVSMPSASEIALIGDDLGKFDFPATLLKDTTKGAGVSAYYRARLS